jgi:hypothetical protein
MAKQDKPTKAIKARYALWGQFAGVFGHQRCRIQFSLVVAHLLSVEGALIGYGIKDAVGR